MNDVLDTDTESEKTITVQVAPGRNRKVITIISGIPPEKMEEILKQLRKIMCCGGHIEKSKGYIHLRGNYMDTIKEKLNTLLPDYKVEQGNKRKDLSI